MLGKLEKEYWASLKPPLAPSDDDVSIYQNNLLTGTTLLLGCTAKLIPLSDKQMDIDPWHSGPTVIKQDWTTNTVHYTNIIGDGVLCFDQELCDKVLMMCSLYSKRFIARCFNRKLDIMRIAAYFPQQDDFSIRPTSVQIFDDYTFFIWQL